MRVGVQMHEVVIQAEHIRFALVVDDARVVAPGPRSVVHDVAFVLPRSLGTVAHRISYALGAAGRCESEVVVAVAFVEPRTFLIILDLIVQLVDRAAERNHVLVELSPVYVRIAPIHVCLAVVVDEDGRVDVLPVFSLPYQRLTERIGERAVRRVSHQHSDAVAVERAVHVEFAVTFNHLERPCAVVP